MWQFLIAGLSKPRAWIEMATPCAILSPTVKQYGVLYILYHLESLKFVKHQRIKNFRVMRGLLDLFGDSGPHVDEMILTNIFFCFFCFVFCSGNVLHPHHPHF